MRPKEINYTQTVMPSGLQETASIRSKALCMIYAIHKGVMLTRRHWKTAVGCVFHVWHILQERAALRSLSKFQSKMPAGQVLWHDIYFLTECGAVGSHRYPSPELRVAVALFNKEAIIP